MKKRTGNHIGKGFGRTSATLGIPRLHDLDLDTENTLTHENVAGGVVDEVTSGLTRVDHESVGELHRLGTGSTEFTRNDNLNTLGSRLHNESEDTVASTIVGCRVKGK